jgi:hypothetical protein
MGRELGESEVGSDSTRASLLPGQHETFTILDIWNQYSLVPCCDPAYGRIQIFTPYYEGHNDL